MLNDRWAKLTPPKKEKTTLFKEKTFYFYLFIVFIILFELYKSKETHLID